MFSFIQFIINENKRSSERAEKILTRLQMSPKMALGKNEMRPIAPVVPWESRTHQGWPIDYDTFKEHGKSENVPLHLIDTTQKSIVPSYVKEKLKGTKKHDPDYPYMIHIPETGRYRLYDGNHRYTAAKLKGESILKGLVVHSDEKPKFEH